MIVSNGCFALILPGLACAKLDQVALAHSLLTAVKEFLLRVG
jgi:hypothetical protein